jgi:hypothetical protein
MLVGLLLIQLMMPSLIPYFSRLFDSGLDQMGRVASALKPPPAEAAACLERMGLARAASLKEKAYARLVGNALVASGALPK